jgi:hypothetical protein
VTRSRTPRTRTDRRTIWIAVVGIVLIVAAVIVVPLTILTGGKGSSHPTASISSGPIGAGTGSAATATPTTGEQDCDVSFDYRTAAWEPDHFFTEPTPLKAGDKVSGSFSGVVTGSPHGWELSFTLPKFGGNTTATHGNQQIELRNVSWGCW